MTPEIGEIAEDYALPGPEYRLDEVEDDDTIGEFRRNLIEPPRWRHRADFAEGHDASP